MAAFAHWTSSGLMYAPARVIRVVFFLPALSAFCGVSHLGLCLQTPKVYTLWAARRSAPYKPQRAWNRSTALLRLCRCYSVIRSLMDYSIYTIPCSEPSVSVAWAVTVFQRMPVLKRSCKISLLPLSIAPPPRKYPFFSYAK
jgi:hypothetical protein